MKRSSFLILALAAGTLAAQESDSLDKRFQAFLEYNKPTEVNVTPDVKDKPKGQTGIGFRFLGEIAGAPGWYYEVGGMFDSSSTFSFNGTSAALGGTLDVSNVKLSNSYWSVGAGYLWKAGQNGSVGLHLEGRGEFLRLQGFATGTGLVVSPTTFDHSTTYLRPWVRASADYTFASGKPVRPFLGLDGSFALLKTTQTELPLNRVDDRMVRSLAPRFGGSVYAGLRF